MDTDDSGIPTGETDVADLNDHDETLSINFNWSVEQEILLFEAMIGHKPVGVDKNIHMMCIHRKLNSKWKTTTKQIVITPEHIWAKLGSMYDLEALNDSECIPFPRKNEEFALPNEDFGPLMNACPSTNSGNSSRSSTVDRESEEDPKAAVRESTPLVDDSSASTSSITTAIPATPTSVSSITPATPTAGPSKPGRKRTKASAQSNQDNDKTPSGPSSAKRSRR